MQINHKAGEVREKLEKSLNAEELKLLNEYCDLTGQAFTYLEFDSFLQGFRLASKLLCEVLVGNDNE